MGRHFLWVGGSEWGWVKIYFGWVGVSGWLGEGEWGWSPVLV